jgi:hypothetical protein
VVAKTEKLPKQLAPSVAMVFADFFQRLEQEPDFNQSVLDRLKGCLLVKQEFDTDALGEALKLPKKTSP